MGDPYSTGTAPIVDRRNLLEKIRDGILSLGGNVGKEFNAIAGLGTGIVNSAGAAIGDALPQAFSASVKFILQQIYAMTGLSTDLIMQVLQGNSIISQQSATVLIRALHGTGLLEPFLGILLLFEHLKGYAGNAFSVTSQQSIQELQKATRYTLPGMGEILRAGFVSPASVARINEIGARQGLSDTDIGLVWKSAYRLLDETSIREIYYRRNRDASFATERLSQLGMTPRTITETMERWDIIPPVQDLVTMAVREAFSEDLAARLGLDAEYPPAFGEWTAKLGLSAEWARKYWRAHWQLPSAGQGFEMFQRNIINEIDLDNLLKALDYSPVWRDKLTRLNYTPLTRVDIRRMYSTNDLSVEDVWNAYQDGGYSPDNATKLTRWTVKQYKQDVTALTRAQIDKSYKMFYMSKVEIENLYSAMGYTREEYNTIISLLTLERENDKRNTTISSTKKLYISHYISTAEAWEKMLSVDVNEDYITSLIEEWNVEILLSTKYPTKADIDKWYKQDIIDSIAYAENMARIGYLSSDIPKYILSLDIEKEEAVNGKAQKHID